MNELVQKTQLRQELKLNPQLMQSMEILQMNSDELLDYLDRACQENPLLEREDRSELDGQLAQLRQRASWIDAGPGAQRLPESWERGRPDRETESLAAFLKDQLDRRRLPERLLALCCYLADLTDENGWLDREDLDSLAEMRVPTALIDQAMEQLQALDPPGVGARDLGECLVLQLRRMGNAPVGAERIAAEFLTELGRGHHRAIARKTGLTQEQVQAAQRAIAALDPHPGRAFRVEEETFYVRPDLFVVDTEEGLQVVINEYYLPRVSISDYYSRLLRQSEEKQTRDYLRQKLQQAHGLLSGLERRGSTLLACARAVLDRQRPFFEEKSDELSPMTLTQAAEILGVHPSTVSRALRGKYLQCRRGTYPMGYFFSRGVGEEATSQQAVRLRLLELIRGEDPAHPLSDRKLCALLEQQGVQAARRTVAKYREQMGVPSSSARRRRG